MESDHWSSVTRGSAIPSYQKEPAHAHKRHLFFIAYLSVSVVKTAGDFQLLVWSVKKRQCLHWFLQLRPISPLTLHTPHLTLHSLPLTPHPLSLTPHPHDLPITPALLTPHLPPLIPPLIPQPPPLSSHPSPYPSSPTLTPHPHPQTCQYFKAMFSHSHVAFRILPSDNVNIENANIIIVYFAFTFVTFRILRGEGGGRGSCCPL